MSLELRLGLAARTTSGIDFLYLGVEPTPLQALQAASKLDLEDWFTFDIERPARNREIGPGGVRFPVVASLDGRRFEAFHVDIGIADDLAEPPETLPFPQSLRFAVISPPRIQVYPIAGQIAEKFHALTLTYASGQSSRAKDVVDILFLAGTQPIHAAPLRKALQATFRQRDTHPLPHTVPDLSGTLATQFGRLASGVELPFSSLTDAESALKAFLDPVLANKRRRTWNPKRWSWIARRTIKGP